MANSFLYRRTEVDLKPFLEDLEKDFKFKLIFNSGCEKISDYKEACFRDYEEVCVAIKTIWEIHLISENEYQALRSYFYRMLNEQMIDTLRTKAANKKED